MKQNQLAVLLGCIYSLLIWSACSNNKGATANFQFNLEKGKVYDYVMDFDVKQEVPGQQVATTMTSNYSMEVVDDDGDVQTIKTTYDRFAMDATMGQKKISADSDRPDTSSGHEITDPSELMGAVFRGLKGKSFTIKVNREGKVVGVNGLQQIAQSMVNNMNLREDMRPVVLQAFGQQFNEQNIKDLFGQAFNIFPDKPVKVGDSWEKRVTGSATLPLELTTTYTVKSIKGDLITLDARSKMNNTSDTTIRGQQSGILIVNANTGLVVRHNFEQLLDGRMKMVAKGKFTGKER